MKENILGTEKISKLIRIFSVPCVISLLVNALYNMVDQIFIGWGVGYLGNGATNVVFPLTIICLAFALMLGDGCSAFLSLKLGEKKEEEAKSGIVSGLILSAILSIIFFIVSYIFLGNLLNLFGCTSELRPFALDYGKFIVIGLPFSMIGSTLNSIIRADGSPKYAMISMLVGAVLNIILDPIFIFVFKMGITGAAIATCISQIVTFIMNVWYLKGIKSFKVHKKDIKLNLTNLRKVCALGVSSFITQMSSVVVLAVLNNLLVKYGSSSIYGSSIPITVVGIVMKINFMIMSIVIGISAGCQPILGYNFGAGKNERVKETFKIVIMISLIVTTIGLLLFQLFPTVLISIFGSGDALYNEFAALTFRIFLMFVILNGVQTASCIFMQAIGSSFKSAILSLSRQVLLLIPIAILFGSLFGIKGILIAGAVSDFISFVITLFILKHELKKLSINVVVETTKENETEVKPVLNKHYVITISREYGSGGRYIGKMIAESLGIKLFDKNLINKVAETSGFSPEFITNSEQNTKSLLNNYAVNSYTLSDKLFTVESEAIKKIAKEDSCVIVGRCADYILKGDKNVINVFIYTDEESKIKRAVAHYGLNKNKAKVEIDKINKNRSSHYRYYTNQKWGYASNYDLCINSDLLGTEKSAEIIKEFVVKTFEQ